MNEMTRSDGVRVYAHVKFDFEEMQRVLSPEQIDATMRGIAKVTSASKPKPLPNGFHAHLDCVGTDGGKAATETVVRDPSFHSG